MSQAIPIPAQFIYLIGRSAISFVGKSALQPQLPEMTCPIVQAQSDQDDIWGPLDGSALTYAKVAEAQGVMLNRLNSLYLLTIAASTYMYQQYQGGLGCDGFAQGGQVFTNGNA